MLTKILSGGQTGADQAALDAAIETNIPHGGWIPKGRLTEAGPLPEKYNLTEMPTKDYLKRTRQNVLDSDGTVIFSHGDLKGGLEADRGFCHRAVQAIPAYRPEEHPALGICRGACCRVNAHDIGVLNIAGSRASKDPEIYSKVKITVGLAINAT